MKDDEIPTKYNYLRNNNYLINAYKNIIKSNFVHFIVSLIEIILIILQELTIFLFKYNYNINLENKFICFIFMLPNKFNNFQELLRVVILLVYSIAFDLLYMLVTKRKFTKKYKSIYLLFNLLEFVFFRILMLVNINIFFSLSYRYFIPLFILFILQINLIKDHFLYNHLYYFVPTFVVYPYDEFSSLFDSILLCIKMLLAILVNIKNINQINICYVLLFIIQIYFSFYFIYLLLNKSYLFMKNSFLSILKLSLFLVQTFSLIIAEVIGQGELISISFLIIIIGSLIIILVFIILLYDPKDYIKIKTETPMDNLFYYFYIVSDKNELTFLLETKINQHYEKCNVCNLCNKYKKYLNSLYYFNNNGKENLNNFEKEKQVNNITALFQILYENKNNYFELINEIVLNYKYNRKKFFINSSYYYINLSFFFFSEFKVENITLSLNLKLLLDIINQNNKFIDNEELQINQIIFCNKFISLSNNIINQLKDILTVEYINAKKYIDLSVLLKEMYSPNNKDVLYNYKQDNSSNLKNIIMICSIIFEEIFNTTINSSQLPIRENYQALDDIFFNNIHINDKVITLAINLTNNNCKIIRAGKSLFQYKDNNLFDLFPLILKDYQVKLFLSKIFRSFNRDNKKYKTHSNENNNDIRRVYSVKRRDTKRYVKSQEIKTKIKKEFIEIKVIICENFSQKLFSKLLILKLAPLFNCDLNNYYILFDGTFYLYKNSILTLQNDESKNYRTPKIISVSKLELEKPPEIYSMKFEKYIIWLEKNGFLLSKIFETNFSNKVYSVYAISPKDNKEIKKKSRASFYQRESIGYFNISEMKNNFGFRNELKKYLFEENSVATSHKKSNNYVVGSSSLLKNKKRENMYRYTSLYKIKNILMISTPFILLTFTLEVFHLNQLKEENINNDYSIVKFDEIYKLYFQLFSSSLNVACLKMNNYCKSIASNVIRDYEQFNIFNFSYFLSVQNKLLAHDLLLKKSNLINIHKNLGNIKYKEIFDTKVNYKRISKTIINGDLSLSLANITIPFSEAMLISINSFQIIVNNTKNEPVYILNKTDEPFYYLFQDEVKNFSDYQKEISEMILNYKIYKDQFININQKFIDTLAIQSQKIELYIYLYFHLTLLICIYILSLLYIYLLNFEKIIIKILNYVNMIRNIKEEKFNFSELFLKKIENIEIILKIYSDAPFNAIQNLNTLYNEYQKYATYLTENHKNNKSNKKYKKIIEEENDKDELDIVPINQRIFNKQDIRKLYIMYYYFLFFIIISCCVFIIYFIILYTWINYSDVKTNLYSLISKNLELEISLYKAINLYDLIIFNNFTIEELSKDIFYSQEKNIFNRETLLNSFYDDLFISFNYEVEITVLRKNFRNFPFFNFTCENLYEVNRDYISELANFTSFKNISEIIKQLIDICEYSRLAEYNDMNAVFQSHYQEIKNSITSIEDNSYQGLINHINEGRLGKIALHFNCILVYLLNLVSNRMHKIEIEDLIILLKENLAVTLAITILLYIILIVIVRLFYIINLKKYCNQIILLKKVFQISRTLEQ